jgi:hypothetical protein
MEGDEEQEYFRKAKEEIKNGLDLIPDKLRIRYVEEEDVERFSEFSIVLDVEKPKIGQVLIEGEYSDPLEYSYGFNIITKTQLALCLLRKEHFFLKYLYSISKDNNRIFSFRLLRPIPLYDQIGPSRETILYHDEKEKIIEVFNKINKINFNENSSFRVACNRLIKSHHNLLPDDEIIDLCIGMEALFFKNITDRSERRTTRKGVIIGLACSMLLGNNDSERREILKNVKNSYRVRNDIVHGDITRFPRLHKLTTSLENYLRKSILRFL